MPLRPPADRDLWFEDFQQGQSWRTDGATLTESAILDFALRYDPQPFHLDSDAARRSPYGGLIASGFQTLSLIFRLWHAERVASPSGSGSPGMDELRWHAPVRPGDTLYAVVTAEEVRPSRSRPGFGLVTWRYEGYNQRDERVLSVKAVVLHRMRPEDRPPETVET